MSEVDAALIDELRSAHLAHNCKSILWTLELMGNWAVSEVC